MKTTPASLLHSSQLPAAEPLEARVAPAFFTPLDLGTTGPAFLSAISGEAAGDQSGFAVSDAGDVNGDGVGDFIIGANTASPGGMTQAGAAYVVFGTHGGFGANLDLSTLDGTNGFKLTGAAAGDNAGWSVGAAGDVNGDGYADVIIGAPSVNANTGAAYIVFGKASGFSPSMSLGALDGTNGVKLSGTSAGDKAGWEANAAGDLNHDGFSDVVIGAVTANSTGRAYVVFGHATGWSANFALGSLNGTTGFKMDGEAASDNFGVAVGKAGDFNGDGIDDLIVSANAADLGGTQNVGAAYVIFGKPTPFSSSLSLASLNGSTGFKVLGAAFGDDLGDSVAGAGDVNGDGLADVVIGAFRVQPNGAYSGASYVIFGTKTAIASPLSVTALDGSNGFKLSGEAFSDLSGYDVKSAGDINGDGYSDICIGAPRSAANYPLAGAGYVVFGKPSGFVSDLQLSTLAGSNGVKLLGAANGDQAGISMSAAGDVNGDGFDDVLISAYNADPHGSNSGKTYVLYGQQIINAIPGGSGKSATFLDANGLYATVTVSKGSLGFDNLILKGLPGGRAELLRLDLSDPMFQGATVKITSSPVPPATAKPQAAGAVAALPSARISSGFVNVGLLDATGVDLGAVTVNGDVARIIAGDGDLTTPAFKSLTVHSLGLLGTMLLNPDDRGDSIVTGPIKTLKVATDVHEFSLNVSNIGTLTIAGSVDHLNLAATNLGTVKVAGSILDSKILLSGVATPVNQGAATVLKTFTLGGSFVRSQLLAGYDSTGTAVHGDVAVGNVTIGGNWLASDLAVGITAGASGVFGDDDDALISAPNAIIAKLAKLVIKGDAYGSFASGDVFGIQAEQIGAANIGLTKVLLSKTAADDLLVGATEDLRLREIT